MNRFGDDGEDEDGGESANQRALGHPMDGYDPRTGSDEAGYRLEDASLQRECIEHGVLSFIPTLFLFHSASSLR